VEAKASYVAGFGAQLAVVDGLGLALHNHLDYIVRQARTKITIPNRLRCEEKQAATEAWMASQQCYCCRDYGHLSRDCPAKFADFVHVTVSAAGSSSRSSSGSARSRVSSGTWASELF